MKKIILLFFFLSLIISSNVQANPIIPPPVTSELYFINNEWTLELVFGNMGYPSVSVSDSLVIITSTDTVAFKPGFNIPLNTPILITKDSLLYPLSINKYGDFVQIAVRNNGSFFNFDYIPMTFGNIVNAQVSAPIPGQSIKRFKCHDFGTGSDIYYIAKDNHPSLGTDPFNATAGSSLSGHVYDSNHNPLPGVVLGPILLYCSPPYTTGISTDANGYFSSSYNYLYSFIRHITIQKQFCNTIDTTFSIEPDSAYIMDFTFDSCYVGINDVSQINNYSLKVFPNPGSENFTFQITAPESNYTNCLIKIYDLTGELVNIIPVNNVHDSFASVTWNGKGKYADLPAGLYTCSLQINDNIVASQKLVIE
ncbi:MAG: T9SS type A sorting domain-containing protein [Bacteroidales bacterium]